MEDVEWRHSGDTLCRLAISGITWIMQRGPCCAVSGLDHATHVQRVVMHVPCSCWPLATHLSTLAPLVCLQSSP